MVKGTHADIIVLKFENNQKLSFLFLFRSLSSSQKLSLSCRISPLSLSLSLSIRTSPSSRQVSLARGQSILVFFIFYSLISGLKRRVKYV